MRIFFPSGHIFTDLGPLAPRAGSRTSSLAPSDSASQQQKVSPDSLTEAEKLKAYNTLLESVYAPSVRPWFLWPSVLWDYEDCEKDTTEGIIVTESNKRRPRMKLAIRRPDGSKVSSLEWLDIRRATNLFVKQLLDFILSDPRNAGLKLTKTVIKNMFGNKYNEIVLALEAEQKLLRLCSAHWKADMLIGQALVRWNDKESKAAMRHRADSSNPNSFDAKHSQLPAARVSDSARVNVAKRVLESSPGPKTPSAMHTQKHQKDDAILRTKTKGPPSNNRECSIHHSPFFTPS